MTEPVGYSYATPAMIKLNGLDQLIFQATINRSRKKGALISFNPDTGEKLWQYDDYYVMAAIPQPIVLNDDVLFHTGGYGAGSIMLKVTKNESAFSINKLFAVSRGSQIHQPILVHDHLYLIVNENANQRMKSKRKEGGLMCLDLAGKVKWRTGDAPNFGRGSMIFADGVFIIQDGHDGKLRLVKPDPKKYHILAEHNIFNIRDNDDHQMWPPMSLSNGRLIVRSQEKLKCIDMRAVK